MKILSISKTNIRSIYSIEKKQEFWSKARELLLRLGLKGAPFDFYGYEEDKSNGPERDIMKYKDIREGFEINKNSSVDFIFGDKRIFIIFTYKKDLQTKFSELAYDIFGGKTKK